MKLTMPGSGTCVPYTERGSSGYALEMPGAGLLLDCGSGAARKPVRTEVTGARDLLEIEN